MKLKKQFLSVTVVYVIIILVLAGFTVHATEPNPQGEEATDLRNQEGFYNFVENIEDISMQSIENTIYVAQKAKEEKEKKVAEEEARRIEEARRAKEEEAQAQVQAQEQKLLASIIFCEAGNQPYEGQVAVGAVVMNRVRSGLYPNTISEVIYQPGQFGPAITGWLDEVLASESYTPSTMQAAQDAIAGANPVGDCLYFGNGTSGMQIGDHYFY